MVPTSRQRLSTTANAEVATILEMSSYFYGQYDRHVGTQQISAGRFVEDHFFRYPLNAPDIVAATVLERQEAEMSACTGLDAIDMPLQDAV